MNPISTSSHSATPHPAPPRPQPRLDTAGAIRPPRQEAAGVEYWRIQRVARYLDITPKRVYQLIQEKKLVSIHLGPRSTRVLRQSIDDYLACLVRDDE